MISSNKIFRCCNQLIITSSCNRPQLCLGKRYLQTSSHEYIKRGYTTRGRYESPRTLKKILFATVGLTLTGLGGIVVYAKSDPKFRQILEANIPGGENFFRIVYQKHDAAVDFINENLRSIQETLSEVSDYYKLIFSDDEDKRAFIPIDEMVQVESSTIEPKAAVARSGMAGGAFNVSQNPDFIKSLECTEKCVDLFNKAIGPAEEAGNEIIKLIEETVEGVTPKRWSEIENKLEEDRKVWEEMNKLAKEAASNGTASKEYYNKGMKRSFTQEELDTVKSSIVRCDEAYGRWNKFNSSRVGAALQYLEHIEKTRKQLLDELQVLFSNVRLDDKQLILKEDAVDLFLCYGAHKLNFYTQQLMKLESQSLEQLKKALQESKDAENIRKKLDQEVDKALSELKKDYDEKAQAMKSSCDEEGKEQMKRQEQIHKTIIDEKLTKKQKEVEERWAQPLIYKVEEERKRLNEELVGMKTRMQGLNEAITKRSLQDTKAETSQALWFAAESLFNSLKSCQCSDPSSFTPTPLYTIVKAIRNASAKGDELVETVVGTIPPIAISRGVYPEDVLKAQFHRVENAAWKVAGVPERKITLVTVALSSLMGRLVVKTGEIPSGELNNEPIDPHTLTNYDILQRARFFVDRGDFHQALKYMNLLKGGARGIASRWMKEATLYLETQQAATLLLAHASTSGMVYC